MNHAKTLNLEQMLFMANIPGHVKMFLTPRRDWAKIQPIMKTHDDFMALALGKARAALAQGEFPVGCVIVADQEVVASGARRGSARNTPGEIDHAEINALRNLEQEIRLPPEKRHNFTLYATLEPCLMCFGAMLISGIFDLVYGAADVWGGGTGCDPTGLSPLYQSRVLTITAGVREEESRALLTAFFNDPERDYLHNTPLAAYFRRP